jgi:hypothetical protein
MKTPHRAQYQISVDGVPRRYHDRQDIALQIARFLKSRNPNRAVRLADRRGDGRGVQGRKRLIVHGAQDALRG